MVPLGLMQQHPRWVPQMCHQGAISLGRRRVHLCVQIFSGNYVEKSFAGTKTRTSEAVGLSM
jgi:hypothetical protein